MISVVEFKTSHNTSSC